jgi:POTRA domain, FtsQ-type
MKVRRRKSRLPHFNWRQSIDSSEPLKGQLWTRSEKALQEPDVHWSRRALAGGAAVVELAILLWLLFGPALAVRNITVSGAQHLSSAQVLQAAGLDGVGSVLSVDALSDQGKLLGQTWVRAATVQPMLDGSVRVVISEWQPVATYHAGPTGKMLLLSDQALVLGTAPSVGGLTNIQGPSGNDPRVGDRPLDPVLLTALVNIQRSFPAYLGQQVAMFIIDSCGNLTLVSGRGWSVYFGRVLTPEEFSSLRDKLAALKAIQGRLNYNSPDLMYVNVMNPNEPAAGFKPKQTQPSPSPSPGVKPSPSPAPTCQ